MVQIKIFCSTIFKNYRSKGIRANDRKFNSALLRFITIIAFLFLHQAFLAAQESLLPVFHFNKLTTADGLPTGEIRSNVVRDQQGFIWIPTINGLARYDGYSCKVFRNNPADSSSISSNLLYSAYLDKKNRIWLGTWDAGLSMYDPIANKFTNFYPRKDDSTWITISTVYLIREDKLGDVWLMGLDGEVVHVNMSELLDQTNPDDLQRHIRFRSYRPGPPGNRIWDIETWGERSVIVSTYRGSFLIDSKTGIVSRPHIALSGGSNLDTTARVTLFRENPSVLWMGTQTHELFRLDEVHGSTKYFPSKSRDGQKLHHDIQVMRMDGFGNLWVGTNSGFELFDTTSGMFRDFLFSPANGPSNEGIETKRISLDNTGTFWVSSGKSGLYYQLHQSGLFSHFGVRDTARKAMEMGTMEKWSDGTLWIDASGKVINVNPATLRVNRVVDLFKGEKPIYTSSGSHESFNDSKGNIWYGTWGLGLYKFEPASGRVSNFRASTQLPDQERDICSSVTGGNGDTLWIAANTGGVLLFDPRTNRFSRPGDAVLSQLSNVIHVMKDRSGRIWISDQRKGLFIAGSSGHVIKHFEHDRKDTSTIAFNNVRDTYEDSQGRIWIGGTSIELWEPANHSFRHYPNSVFNQAVLVTPMGTDTWGRLWVRYSSTGIALLDPATGVYANYDWSDGLCGNVLGMSSLSDGTIALVGQHGLNIADLHDLQGNYLPPPVNLTKIMINDMLDVSSQVTNGFRTLGLPNGSDGIEIEFAAINPGTSHQVKYHYRLEGLENSWIDPNNRRYVRYPGLSSGTYFFRVKAINTFGRWQDQEIAVAFSLAPVWWQSWWAFILYGLCIAGIAVTGYMQHVKQIRLKHQIEMEHFQSARLAEVDKLKTKFFANISHEFRTPLTLLLGPIERAIERATDPQQQKTLKIIRQNAKKLHFLVNQLLDFSRFESGTVKLNVLAGDISGTIRTIILSFESWAERKTVTLQYTSEFDRTDCYFDGEKLEKIMNNLLSNALKFTKAGGKIMVYVSPALLPSTEPEGRRAVMISISDTGIGIPFEHIPHIFERFYRLDETHAIEGSGIGLALVKELVDLHYGTIEVQSSPGIGSKFTVTLPVDKSAYSLDELLTTPVAPEKQEYPVDLEDAVENAVKLPAKGKPVLLLVEDNADVRTYIHEHFEIDYAVIEAENGKVGCDLATERIPDIVVSDVMMPLMDGYELCRTLKRDVRTSHVPIILLTARAATDSKIKGLSLGADDYVTKPFEIKELSARVRNLINQRQQLRKKFSGGTVLKPGEVAVTSLDDNLLKKIMCAVEKRIGDENFSIDDLAREACLSRAHLNRKLNALTNLSTAEFIKYVRLQRARDLLQKNAGSIADIAFQVGFGSPSYFSASFRERFGVAPSEINHLSQKEGSTPMSGGPAQIA